MSKIKLYGKFWLKEPFNIFELFLLFTATIGAVLNETLLAKSDNLDN